MNTPAATATMPKSQTSNFVIRRELMLLNRCGRGLGHRYSPAGEFRYPVSPAFAASDFQILLLLLRKMCAGEDLNLHALRHTPLKRTCLPVSPPAHILTPANYIQHYFYYQVFGLEKRALRPFFDYSVLVSAGVASAAASAGAAWTV